MQRVVTDSDRQRRRELQAKWDAIYRNRPPVTPQAAPVLSEFAHLLPAKGCALDVACGAGGNALLLAGRGLETWAWDISAVAVERLQRWADAGGLPIHAQSVDVETTSIDAARFDVIVVSRFLVRALAEPLVAALKPGGLMFYQTFTRNAVDASGPGNRAYRLECNELLSLFSSLVIRYYREEGSVGDISRGVRNEALLIGQKTGS